MCKDPYAENDKILTENEQNNGLKYITVKHQCLPN